VNDAAMCWQSFMYARGCVAVVACA
jgi:hypothetical protein